MSTQRPDLYAMVTDKFIQALENGTVPWVKPWTTTSPRGLPHNGATGHRYQGVNVFLTYIAQLASGWTSQEWFTFNQARKLGGNVKRGSHATMLVFYKDMFITKEDEDTGEERKIKIPLLRYFSVFNRDQCEDLPESKYERPDTRPMPERMEDAEIFFDRLGAKMVHSDQAWYSPSRDEIGMPDPRDFKSMPNYYATLAHEHVHWTGHKKRLDRETGKFFGTPEYAYEELVAEMGSAFVCADLGIAGDLRHEAYVVNWIKKLRDDKKFIFRASADARRAHVFMMPPAAEDEEADGE